MNQWGVSSNHFCYFFPSMATISKISIFRSCSNSSILTSKICFCLQVWQKKKLKKKFKHYFWIEISEGLTSKVWVFVWLDLKRWVKNQWAFWILHFGSCSRAWYQWISSPLPPLMPLYHQRFRMMAKGGLRSEDEFFQTQNLKTKHENFIGKEITLNNHLVKKKNTQWCKDTCQLAVPYFGLGVIQTGGITGEW